MSTKFALPAPMVEVIFTPLAFSKMLPLIMYSDKEIAWHGTVERTENKFRITDIMIYPQKVTGATVTTDQTAYEDWLYKKTPIEVFKKIRFQGHSHVNMGCTPSGTDEKCKDDVLKSIKQDDFYLFMIWNKSLSFTGELFDATTWIKYQTKDMRVSIEGVGSLEDYINHIKSLVKITTATPGSTVTYKRTSLETPPHKNDFDCAAFITALESFNTLTKTTRKKDRQSLYNTFCIPKKTGGLRTINAPNEELSNALKMLKAIFEQYVGDYYHHAAAHAYVRNRSNKTAVMVHQKAESKWFVKFDFSDFFGSTTLDFIMEMCKIIYPMNMVGLLAGIISGL